MNFGLMLSCRVEEKLQRYHNPTPLHWTQIDEALAYETCLKEVLKEHGRAWADGNIRVGDYIVLIDSDTRVPTDCLLDAASEMEQSVSAILQPKTADADHDSAQRRYNAILLRRNASCSHLL